MLSSYFYAKTNLQVFKYKLNNLLDSLQEKKVLLYGAGEAFFEIDKMYNIKQKLDIVCIADKKFETNSKDVTGLRQILPADILKENYDKILITNERPAGVYKFLTTKLNIQKDKIEEIFVEDIKDESINYYFLQEHKFSKTLPKLINSLKNQTVVLYGAGAFLETIFRYYDLSGLNIIGVSDKKFDEHKDDETFLGYKVYSIDELVRKVNPDCIVVATKMYTSIIEDFYYVQFRGLNIKIKPLVKKRFFELIREIW